MIRKSATRVTTTCPTLSCEAAVGVTEIDGVPTVAFCPDCSDRTAAISADTTWFALASRFCTDCGDTLAWCPRATAKFPQLAQERR